MLVTDSNGEYYNRHLLRFDEDFVQLTFPITDEQLTKLNEAMDEDVSEPDCPFEEWVTRILDYVGIKREHWMFLWLDPCFTVKQSY
jgi:hypothetical protein